MSEKPWEGWVLQRQETVRGRLRWYATRGEECRLAALETSYGLGVVQKPEHSWSIPFSEDRAHSEAKVCAWFRSQGGIVPNEEGGPNEETELLLRLVVAIGIAAGKTCDEMPTDPRALRELGERWLKEVTRG